MKQTKLWNEIANDPKWKAVQGMTESKLPPTGQQMI